MNLDDLTLGQVKELKTMLLSNTELVVKKNKMIGKTCMFRTYSAGVHFGVLEEKNGEECLVSNAQRVYYWTEACSLSQLAMEGSKNFDGCKISMAVDEIILGQAIEIIPMPSKTVEAFRAAKIWKK